MNKEECVTRRAYIGGNPTLKIRRLLFEASLTDAWKMTSNNSDWIVYEFCIRIPLSLVESFERNGVVAAELEDADGYPLLVCVHTKNRQ